MSASTPDPTGRPLADGPHDPEHDPTAAYALEPEYVEALTRRILATSGETAEVRSPINGAPLAHIPQSTVALAVDLDHTETDRLPPQRSVTWLNVTVPLLHKVESGHFAAAILQYLRAGRRP